MIKEAPKTNQGHILTIQENFYIDGFNYDGHVSTIEQVDEEIPNLVNHCLPDDTRSNWKAINILKIISISM